MKFCTSILLSVVFFAVSSLAISGSDACLASECQGLLLQASDCSFPLQTATTITTSQAACVCYGAGFTDVLDECISCMQPYNIASFNRSTWNSFCPAGAAGNGSVTPAGPENAGTSGDGSPTPTEASDPFQSSSSAAAPPGGCPRCVVGGLLLTLGIGFWGAV